MIRAYREGWSVRVARIKRGISLYVSDAGCPENAKSDPLRMIFALPSSLGRHERGYEQSDLK